MEALIDCYDRVNVYGRRGGDRNYLRRIRVESMRQYQPSGVLFEMIIKLLMNAHHQYLVRFCEINVVEIWPSTVRHPGFGLLYCCYGE